MSDLESMSAFAMRQKAEQRRALREREEAKSGLRDIPELLIDKGSSVNEAKLIIISIKQPSGLSRSWSIDLTNGGYFSRQGARKTLYDLLDAYSYKDAESKVRIIVSNLTLRERLKLSSGEGIVGVLPYPAQETVFNNALEELIKKLLRYEG